MDKKFDFKKLEFVPVLKDGVMLGIKNFPSLILATLLYLVTIWIPYLNVGTTIAMSTIPLELAKGTIINPTFIFNAEYRKIMPEYFTLIGLQFIALVPAFCFMFVPGIILGLAWSQAILLMLDKKLSPTECLVLSNKITYGNKWMIFLVSFVISVSVSILGTLFGLINDTLGSIVSTVLFVLSVPITLGCDSVIYQMLTKEEVAEITE